MSTHGLPHQESDSLASLLNPVGRPPLLTREREQELAAIIAASPKDANKVPLDEDAIAAVEELVRHNIRFAVRQARRMSSVGVPLDDLVSAGYIGLYKAACRFAPGHSGKFISYAVHHVRNELQVCVSRTASVITYPAHTATYTRDLILFEEKLVNEGRRVLDIDPDEYAEASGLSRSCADYQVDFFMRKRRVARGNRHQTFEGEEKRDERWDVLAVEYGDSPDKDAARRQDRDLIEMLLQSLCPTQRRAVEGCILADRRVSEVAEEEGVTRQALDARLLKAVAKMRHRYHRLVAMGKIKVV